MDSSTYLGNLAKLADDLAITVNHLFLEVHTNLTPRFRIINNPSTVEYG